VETCKYNLLGRGHRVRDEQEKPKTVVGVLIERGEREQG
jgi:hypothetical protein